MVLLYFSNMNILSFVLDLMQRNIKHYQVLENPNLATFLSIINWYLQLHFALSL